jgi:hypothetical protein
MNRTSINLPVSLLHGLQLEAKQRKTSMADLVRHILEKALTDQQAARIERLYEAVEKIKGIGKTTQTDTSSRVNEILYGPEGAWKGPHESG